MRVVLQRVSEASVVVDGETVGAIGPGILLLAAIGTDDTEERVAKMAEKCANLRVFPGEKGHFEISALERPGEVLAVSQFTLYGDCRKGRRPSLSHAAPPGKAEPLFDRFQRELQRLGLRVATGRFGALMRVRLVNDGPVTFLLDT
ncbi:MAG: D-tyrosyl-tRNA(Tyr) deacylase [Candidatus Eisenbacteria bacterium]|nr:D-tyrosyl-tRNA(Tyr) deacylase [Candidatus Eisenbacteria bacterium]